MAIRFANSPEHNARLEGVLLAGYRPPARKPRTAKGREIMSDVDPVSGINQEWYNRNNPRKRSRTVSDNLSRQDLDREANALSYELLDLRNAGNQGALSDIDKRGEGIVTYQRELNKLDSSKDGVRFFNLAPSVFPERFAAFQRNLYRALDNKVQGRMKLTGQSYVDALKALTVGNDMPASLLSGGGTTNNTRS